MTVRPEIKARRRRIVGDHIIREHWRTGRTALEQYLERVKDLNPIHEKINRRAESEEAQIP